MAMPRATQNRLAARMSIVTPKLRDVLVEAGDVMPYIYFPLGGIMSILAVMDDGDAVEISTVGSEGMVGVPVFLGSSTSPSRAVQQAVGAAWRMTAKDFMKEVDRDKTLGAILRRYTQTFFVQVSQSAACNRLHEANERMARWLLMCHDRVGADEFPITHEFLAQMLGVRRATVTVIAGMLQKAGIVRYQRGIVSIVDREKLEEASCECYRIINAEYERLFHSNGNGAKH
ncbi:MAG TPA: Crp/Fnr family transcriptional regulator [Thermoanaerobaculia bacterium]